MVNDLSEINKWPYLQAKPSQNPQNQIWVNFIKTAHPVWLFNQ
jgi:hypothetical protein